MTSPTTIDLSVLEIDTELVAVANTLAETSDLEVAVAAEGRRQALLSARRIAVVAERARVRQQQLEEIQEAHAYFAALEADIPPQLRELAAAIDRVMAELARIVAEYRRKVEELAAIQAVVSAPVGRELHLFQLVERLVAIDQTIEEGLARLGVLRHITLTPLARNPANTVEAYVVHREQRLLGDARPWLPALPTADDAGEASPASLVRDPDIDPCPGMDGDEAPVN